MTDYLWRRILAPQSLAGIIENYAQIVTEKNPATGKKTSAAVSRALGATADADEDETVEDQINRIIEAKKPLPNASYFAFTTTPKNKTLEMFGEPVANPDGTVSHRPFHAYTMKQAIQEGFIVDVLENYTPSAATTSSRTPSRIRHPATMTTRTPTAIAHPSGLLAS